MSAPVAGFTQEPLTALWDLSRPDWETRIREGRSLMPDLTLFADEGDLAVAFFDNLRLPDVPGQPYLRDAAGPWFREIVRALFGSRDPATNIRHIREIFALLPKGSSKTSYSAALMIVALLMNQRPLAEFLLIGPTQAIADYAFSQAKGMIELDPELMKRFQIREHIKEIKDRVTKAKLKIKTFDLSILTGSKPAGVLLDEVHLLGKIAAASKVIRQIRGGLEKVTEGFLVEITTQSDAPPAGAFKDELTTARAIRDGKQPGRMLPVIYEFPKEIAQKEALWSNPENWAMVMPNLGRSVHLASLIEDWNTERRKGGHAKIVWASQHLNIEVGVGVSTDRWPGAEFWQSRVNPDMAAVSRQEALQVLLKRSEVVVVGLDGGGLDDLYGMNVLGRVPGEIEVEVDVHGRKITVKMKRWLSWSHAWCHEGVLERRQSIASRLLDFAKAEELTIVSSELEDIASIVGIVRDIDERGLLACVAADPAGLGETVDALAGIDVTIENGKLVGVPQGYAMMNAIKTAERKLVNGTLEHCGSSLMAWAVSNLKIEPLATAIRATKQSAGDAKIDPAMALFDAGFVMARNPEALGAFPDDYELPVWA